MVGMAEVKRTSRMQIEQLFGECWEAAKTHKEALGEGLMILADALDRDLSKGRTLDVYLAVMSGLSQQECIQALATAIEQGQYFPAPSVLLRYAGRAEVIAAEDMHPLAKQARLSLEGVFTAMRRHGPELDPIPGPLLRDKDNDGRVLMKPVYGPPTPCPSFPPRTQRAIEAMGWGDIHAGLAAIARHPAVTHPGGNIDMRTERVSFAGKTAQEIEQAWIRAYAGAGEE